MTKKDDDPRNIYMEGMYIQTINGSGDITFDIEQNYSTNAFLTSNNIFSAAAFSAKSNSAAKWPESNIPGQAELDVHLGEVGISPTELMRSPNPPNVDGHKDMHEIDHLDGLYFNDTDKVRNHEIYRLGIGDPRWRF